MNKVYIVGGNASITQMFMANGWRVVDHAEDSNLLCFTGGADVSPMLYGEVRGPYTDIDLARDEREANIYYENLGNRPMVGICRGGQFLNVMNGGKLIQHVRGHTRDHMMRDLTSGLEIRVTSTHHQMMIPADTGKVLAYANDNDTEVVVYRNTMCLCYQPHPEYVGLYDPCQAYFFKLIANELNKEMN